MEAKNYSIRTSGEAVGVIIREIIVIYVSVFFIGAKLQLFFQNKCKKKYKSQFLTNRGAFVIKKKIYILN